MGRYRRSIWGSGHARKLLALLPVDSMPERHETPEGIRICARRCYRWVSNGKTGKDRRTEPELTGGLVLTAHLPKPSYGWNNGTFMTRRLRPGWWEEQFLGAADDLLIQCRAGLNLQKRREQVHAAADNLETNPAFCDAVEAEEKRLGRTSDFSTMTAEDCDHWLSWLAEWKGKQ